MTSLRDLMIRRIRIAGPMTVAAFMTEAMHHPEYGYYARGTPFGRAGDFITAPDVSQMFGELVGLWLAEAWRQSGSPASAVLVDLGPGRGTLMTDLLRSARGMPGFPAAMALHLVEASPALRAMQQERFTGLDAAWHASIETVPEGPLFLIANEFFDALPIHQLQRTSKGWRERMVGEKDGALSWVLGPGTPAVAGLLKDSGASSGASSGTSNEAACGALVELCPAAFGVAAWIAERIARCGGAALLVDYGGEGNGGVGTFQAVRQHRHEDVFAAPGTADLTAHVDFAALRRAIRPHAAMHGPVSQGLFLEKLGIAKRAEILMRRANFRQTREIETALQRLTGAAEMGELFKACAVLPLGAPIPAGFAE